MSLNEWTAVTNLTLTNIASVAESNQQSQVQDVLDVAFVPGTQTISLGATNATPFQFFQVVMPYDYVILADQVLLGNTNYTPRLIVVNMPGVIDDACYVNEASSFICYAKPVVQLNGSGPSIRQIATALANSLGMNWTTASQFTYNATNGLGQLLATVVETEPPSSDPVPGQSPPGVPIVINF